MKDADSFISADIFPLKLTDKCCKALELMNEWSVCNLPVLNKELQLVGYVSSEDLAFPENDNDPIGDYLRNDVQYKLGVGQSVFDLLRDIGESRLSAYAMVDNTDNFLGVADLRHIMKKLASFISFSQLGAALSVEMVSRDYSISEIGRIIESNDMKLIGLFVRNAENEGKIEVLIKVNKTDVKSLLATFNRYNYVVQVLNVNKEDIDYLKDRYDSFMKYLDI